MNKISCRDDYNLEIINCLDFNSLKMLLKLWVVSLIVRTQGGTLAVGEPPAGRVPYARSCTKKWTSTYVKFERRGVPIKKMTVAITYMLLILLLSCGDINPKPGPIKFPCGECHKSVKSTQRALCCDSCDVWTHAKCIVDMSVQEYNELEMTDEYWMCWGCTLLPFSDSFFSEVNIMKSLSNINPLSDTNNQPDLPFSNCDISNHDNSCDSSLSGSVDTDLISPNLSLAHLDDDNTSENDDSRGTEESIASLMLLIRKTYQKNLINGTFEYQ